MVQLGEVSSPLLGAWGLALLAVAYFVWSILFHPLRKFPGPLPARLTSLWITWQCRSVHRSDTVEKLHQKYAPFHQVRPVIFTARDPQVHATKRKYLNPGFSNRALLGFENRMNDDVLELKKSFMGKVKERGSARLDFCVWSNYLAFDAIADFAFGKPFGFVASGEDPASLVHTIDTRGEVLNALGNLSLWIRPYMKYLAFDQFWSRGLRAKSGLETLGRQSFQRRKVSQENCADLLGLLFSAKDSNTGGPLPDEEIVAESISFIVGGSDTTSSTMTHFVDLVSRDPVLQSQLQEELDKAFPGKMDADWVAPDSVVNGLLLLNATMKEVMRLRPTSSTGLERVVPQGGREIAGQFFAAGTLVSVPTASIMHDASIYESPYEFKPQRWLADNASILNEYWHPFSLGPRSCIGRNFAWMEMTKTLATLFKTFTIKRATTQPTTLREGFFVKATECWVTLETR